MRKSVSAQLIRLSRIIFTVKTDVLLITTLRIPPQCWLFIDSLIEQVATDTGNSLGSFAQYLLTKFDTEVVAAIPQLLKFVSVYTRRPQDINKHSLFSPLDGTLIHRSQAEAGVFLTDPLLTMESWVSVAWQKSCINLESWQKRSIALNRFVAECILQFL